jgi:putative oxidoreductase
METDMNATPELYQGVHPSVSSWRSRVAARKSLLSLHSRYVHLASRLQSFFLLFLRLTIAWQLAESGLGHLMNVQGTAQHFKEWGVPLPVLSVYISGTTEIVGGIMLILGFGARFIAVPLLINFIVAYAAASRDNLIQVIAGPKRLEGYDAVINDAAFTMIVLSLAMLAFGAGRVSVDYLIERRVQKAAAGTR